MGYLWQAIQFGVRSKIVYLPWTQLLLLLVILTQSDKLTQTEELQESKKNLNFVKRQILH